MRHTATSRTVSQSRNIDHNLKLCRLTSNSLNSGALMLTPSENPDSNGTTSGTIFSLQISGGGVPKHSISQVEITVNGLVGDRQANLKFHGGINRAVCLWSQEVIAQLQAEGHPISPGSAGENITLVGLNWKAIVPSRRLYLGSSVILEITDYAPPCRTIMSCFANRKYSRINQKHYPGQSRLYAKVVSTGTLYPGDPVHTD